MGAVTRKRPRILVPQTAQVLLYRDEAMTVDVTNVNEAPTAIAPTSHAVAENTDTTAGVSLAVLGTGCG